MDTEENSKDSSNNDNTDKAPGRVAAFVHRAARPAAIAALVAGVLVALHQVLNTWADEKYATGLGRVVSGSAVSGWVLASLAGIVTGAVLVYLARSYTTGSWSNAARHPRRKVMTAVGILVILASVVSVVQAGRTANRTGFDGLKAYRADLVVTDTAHPTYQERVPYPQAVEQVRQRLGDAAGRASDPMYVPQGDLREWCVFTTTTTKTSFGMAEHRWADDVICVGPLGERRSASFDSQASQRVGSPQGTFRSKLADQVAELHHGLVFDEADVYGYVTKEGEARLVVPVVERTGFGLVAPDMPAGVVVFEHDGSRRWVRDVAAGEIPGPVMPGQVAVATRQSLRTTQGLVAFKSPSGRDGFYDVPGASEGDADADSVNAGNQSEFLLQRADGRLVWVTPLTPFGDSKAIVAYLEVPADTVRYMQPPTATLHELGGEEAGIEAVAQRVTALYGRAIGLGGSGSNIFELTPTGPGQVLATIGVGPQTQYRVRADVVGGEAAGIREVCIFAVSQGNERKIRCDSAEVTQVPFDALTGTSAGTPVPSGEASQPGSVSDLSQVPTEQLVAELARRFPPTPAAPPAG